MSKIMTKLKQTLLTNRAIISIDGMDAKNFLQGLISNDMNKVTNTQSIYAAFLTPQGKYLFDFFVFKRDETFLIDSEKERLDDLLKRLTMFKLRSDIKLCNCVDEYNITAIWGTSAAHKYGLKKIPGLTKKVNNDIIAVDPRSSDAGLRIISKSDERKPLHGHEANFSDYDTHRLMLGLPDGSRDLIVDKTILLEASFEEINGVDFNKGCYLGQEVTARSKYRGLIKKYFVPFKFSSSSIKTNTAILLDEKMVGQTRSVSDGIGMAIIRIDALKKGAYLTLDNGDPITLLKSH